MCKLFTIKYKEGTVIDQSTLRLPLSIRFDSADAFIDAISTSIPLSEIFECVQQFGLCYGYFGTLINDPTLNDIPLVPPLHLMDEYRPQVAYDLSGMFYNSCYNHPLDKWDLTPIFDTSYMFTKAKFHQDLSMWDIQPDCDCRGMFHLSRFTVDEVKNWKWVQNLNMPIEDLFREHEDFSYTKLAADLLPYEITN